MRLATDALGANRERESNLQQASSFSRLYPGHRDLVAAREFEEHLRLPPWVQPLVDPPGQREGALPASNSEPGR